MTSSLFATPRRAPPNPSLSETLSRALPKDSRFNIYHLSTPPTKTEPLCSAPPDARPDKTFIERHFLAVSIDVPSSHSTAGAVKRASPGADDPKDSHKQQVIVLGLEVFLFTTAYTTTLFVSKADSTGFLKLLNLPPGATSPIRTICSTFIAYLFEHRQRKSVQFVCNLFARAQAQYLFPDSALNDGKHVLSDFGLVRWWCRVLDDVLQQQDSDCANPFHRRRNEKACMVKGYLTVPGLEDAQTRALLPRTSPTASKWTLGHPMERLSHYTREYDWVPLRCLIPKYPDDPKSRFRDELDEEAAKWKQDMGAWRSVTSLEQFWEMMAFRQECSSGRLTGFIWVVWDPPETKEAGVSASQSSLLPTPEQSQLQTPNASFDGLPNLGMPSTPPRRRVDVLATTPHSSPLKINLTPGTTSVSPEQKKKKKKKEKLTGRIVPRAPQIKTAQRNYLLDRPTSTAYYYWPPEGRGERIVTESDYKRIVELLLHLDFEGLNKAAGATARWVGDVGMAGGSKWGQEVVGRKVVEKKVETHMKGVTNLTGLVRKKPKPGQTTEGNGKGTPAEPEAPRFNVLGAGLVRKKPKVAS